MLDVLAEEATKQGALGRMVVVHADLGRCEWPETRALAEEQADHYGFRFEVVRRTQNDLLGHVRQRRKWPAKFQRYCTSDHKRGPIWTLFTRLAREGHDCGRVNLFDGPCRILNCMGMRAEESPDRAAMVPFQAAVKPTNSRKRIDNWLPIHDWNAWQVWDRIGRSGVRHHRAYDLGMPRLSCMFCVFASKAALMTAGEHNRPLLDEYVAVEEEIGHTFRKGFAIAEIAEALDRGERAGAVDNWRA